MRHLGRRFFLLALLLASVSVFAQENAVRVGVALLQNNAGGPFHQISSATGW
jgi:hypothetical protein